jgi:hypothetical protein
MVAAEKAALRAGRRTASFSFRISNENTENREYPPTSRAAAVGKSAPVAGIQARMTVGGLLSCA